MSRSRADHADQSAPTLSIVVPMFNEEDVLPILFDRLGQFLENLGESYEIICVNDGSTDGTARILADAHARDNHIKVVNFSRNFGKEIALTAGLDVASGEAVVPIDADLQDPPELIETFLEKWREGYDVVYAVRQRRDTDTVVKRWSAIKFYQIINRLSGVPIPANTGDFRLMDQRVVRSIARLREHNRFMKGLFAWVGFRHAEVFYDRPERAAGQTKFNYWRLWNFALDGITGFSTVPLRIAGYIGMLTALAAIIYGLFLTMRTLIHGVDVPGYASLMVAVLLIGGLQLVVLGVIGEYLGRLFDEARKRPLYIVESSLGLTAGDDGSA
ncbi:MULTISPECIES: glycosyltransferase family 2 protein [unclassified Ruegeria]|uniref:glycosyltransferase family 2 protein n=1 Tax=unclassified Ruegeria TaxID=2625375 RepID=UPI0014922B9A|nr:MULTISPECIES: glycosyltransferase family 2 protein [unclassified Ruegeria]NOD36589.1 glycosyltransferase [Ruegeria sp. HKCCD7296]NOE43829.1 glycosyltransferase [Ruegeria sp. HKCCD7319]